MRRTIPVLLALLTAAIGARAPGRAAGSANLVPSNLRCDYIVNPLATHPNCPARKQLFSPDTENLTAPAAPERYLTMAETRSIHAHVLNNRVLGHV